MVRFVHYALLASLALLPSSFTVIPATAQEYPSKAVRIIVPFGAGGPADALGRVLAQHLSDELKQPFVVEPRPGAGATIGTEAVARSAPDGYTLLLVSNSHTVNETLQPKRQFNLMRDFVTVAAINYSDIALLVHPKVEAKTIEEFVALAKKMPGKINYGTSGLGSAYHMAGELLQMMTGIKLTHVPHKASGDMRSSVLGGHLEMMFDGITVAMPNVKAGKLRALATTGKRRSKVMPDLPTLSETVAPGYETFLWFGIMAPAGTPDDVVQKLNAALRKVIARRDVQELWAKQGSYPLEMAPADFDKFLREDIARWAKVIEAAGVALP